MARTHSRMVDLDTAAPDFRLRSCNPEVDGFEGPYRSLDDFAGAAVVVVMFICNHCPFVKHLKSALVQIAKDYEASGVQFVAINSNDATGYPEDSFEAMRSDALHFGYPFPYLYDESQEVAVAFGAECTPDFFVFDSDRRLVYRGRFDSSRPGHGEADGRDLRAALDELIASGTVTVEQYPSMGCNIKWRR